MAHKSDEVQMGKSTRIVPFNVWPKMIRDRWDTNLKRRSLLQTRNFEWGEVMTRNATSAYGAWLGWLTAPRIACLLQEPAPSPEELVAYVGYLKDNFADSTVIHRVAHLGRAVALLDLGVTRSYFKSVISNLKAQEVRTSDKRLRVQEPASLIALGEELMEASKEGTTTDTAIQFRDGLQIALLAARPLRQKNFCALRIGTHIFKQGESWWMDIDKTEAKRRKAFAEPFPPQLVPRLQHYLAHPRPILLRGAATDRLWISSFGRPQSTKSIFHGITRETEKRFGKSVNPHLFRDCAATSIAVHDPVNVRIISPLLGHGSFATAETSYNQARAVDASRRHSATIESLRSRLLKVRSKAKRQLT